MTITNVTEFGIDTYEVLDKIPSGYKVWNIGRHAPEGYLPVCVVRKDYHIIPETLKAVPIDPKDYAVISNAVHHGMDDKKATERYLKRKNIKYRDLAEKALAIYETLSE